VDFFSSKNIMVKTFRRKEFYFDPTDLILVRCQARATRARQMVEKYQNSVSINLPVVRIFSFPEDMNPEFQNNDD